MTTNVKTKNALTKASGGQAGVKSTRKPGRPELKKSFDGRELLLSTAHELLIESHGLPVSMNYICARAGINQAMVRYHFGGKHELMAALFERVSSNWLEPLNNLIELDISPRKKLKIHIKQIIKNFQTHPYISRLMTELQLTSDREVQKRLSDSFVNGLLKLYQHIIDSGVRSGEIKNIDPLHLFLSVVGLCDYIFAAQPMLEAGLGIKMTDELLESLVNHTTNLILDGVSK